MYIIITLDNFCNYKPNATGLVYKKYINFTDNLYYCYFLACNMPMSKEQSSILERKRITEYISLHMNFGAAV